VNGMLLTSSQTLRMPSINLSVGEPVVGIHSYKRLRTHISVEGLEDLFSI